MSRARRLYPCGAIWRDLAQSGAIWLNLARSPDRPPSQRLGRWA
ncbi:hypothetical protein [Thermoleptolyngbya sp. M55_K2018_002]|nr:hypothetical protein [Thermoleptolyngbya sp. M55_K2018_002]